MKKLLVLLACLVSLSSCALFSQEKPAQKEKGNTEISGENANSEENLETDSEKNAEGDTSKVDPWKGDGSFVEPKTIPEVYAELMCIFNETLAIAKLPKANSVEAKVRAAELTTRTNNVLAGSGYKNNDEFMKAVEPLRNDPSFLPELMALIREECNPGEEFEKVVEDIFKNAPKTTPPPFVLPPALQELKDLREKKEGQQ
ncbi:hypothetical protein HZA38_01025 [Candidatus Peregrinibacteria bacterium]|nr:hypothetical protein [Candidatus Peregrinibacteria bacterium]